MNMWQLLLMFGLVISASDVDPYVKGNVIFFPSGAEVRFEPFQKFRKPEEGAKIGAAVEQRQMVVIIKEWRRILLITTNAYYEGGDSEISIYDYSGKKILPSFKWISETSPPLVLIKTRRLVLYSFSFEYGPGDTYILDMDGNIVNTLKSNTEYDRIEKSADDELFYIFKTAPGWVKDKVEIFDRNGVLLATYEMKQEEKATFEYSGKKYLIKMR